MMYALLVRPSAHPLSPSPTPGKRALGQTSYRVELLNDAEVSGWGVYCCDFLLLPIASYCFLLLHIASYCFLLLPIASYCFLLLPVSPARG